MQGPLQQGPPDRLRHLGTGTFMPSITVCTSGATVVAVPLWQFARLETVADLVRYQEKTRHLPRLKQHPTVPSQSGGGSGGYNRPIAVHAQSNRWRPCEANGIGMCHDRAEQSFVPCTEDLAS
jgi:hypothetical protein